MTVLMTKAHLLGEGIFFGCGRETTDGDFPRRINSLSGSHVCLGYIFYQPG